MRIFYKLDGLNQATWQQVTVGPEVESWENGQDNAESDNYLHEMLARRQPPEVDTFFLAPLSEGGQFVLFLRWWHSVIVMK